MTLKELTEIIKTADRSEIVWRLTKLGYVFCNEDKKLGKVGITELVRSVKLETEDFADDGRKQLYNGRICGKVNGYENFEFIYVNVYSIKSSEDPFDSEEMAKQTEMLIWAKEF